MDDSTTERFKLCVDVHYSGLNATVAGVLFLEWDDDTPADEVTITTAISSDYEPGAFYKRELPCILELISKLPKRPEVIVIDGYVWLGRDRPGLGHHLFSALSGNTPIVGVAKNRFDGADEATPVVRGESRRPLFVTADGIPSNEAAKRVEAMHGDHRIPFLIKRADQISRLTARHVSD